MATYAIGDLQGCYHELKHLLKKIKFDKKSDRLWFCGDLVNRGPDSLAVLRFIMKLGKSATSILGNHDLHLLAIASLNKKSRTKDTLNEILEADDRHEILEWLRQQPLCHYDQKLNFLMVHAGLHPDWSIKQTLSLAGEVEAALRKKKYKEFFENMYGNTPDNWSNHLSGWDRLRVITNYLTRVRYCQSDGSLDFKESGSPGSQSKGLIPWYKLRGKSSKDSRVLFGHWSTLRLLGEDPVKYHVYHLDTGCLWGGDLTALRLEDQKWFSVPSTTNKLG